DDLSEEEIEGIPDEFTHQFLEDTWQVEPTTKPPEDVQVDTRSRVINIALALGIFLLALLPRLYVLFFVTDPQDPGIYWYGDAFHHWQVAYLSKEIGFSHGFLRLWDFKGMEYFWGLLHPLTLAFLFSITGSIDILVPRLLSVVGGSASLVIVFFLLRRHFNLHVALAGIFLATINPVAIFSDTVGMQEPIGLVLLFLGLFLWPNRPIWSGFLWAMAGMVRADYWIFGAGLVAVGMIMEKDTGRRLSVSLGWGIPILVYMKYMLDHTGNAIYPIYWNFMAGTVGKWIDERPLTAEQVQVQFAARIVLLITVALILLILWRRPKYSLFLLLGLSNILMLSTVLGLGAYIRGYVTRVLWDRLMVIPYMYLGIFLAFILMYVLLRRIKNRRIWLALSWIVVLLVLSVSQLSWQPIMRTYSNSHELWSVEEELADDIASSYDSGVILIPEDRPYLTYLLVRNHGVTGRNLQGQMYDPFAYFDDDPFTNWSESRKVIRDWLSRDDIRLLVFYSGKPNYEEMIQREPGWFNYIMTAHLGKIQIYEVAVQ
ncbi:MAG: hypothetical protein KAJ19_27755, partial [Gammaproteobacteria bacterium]|nr:hypothetical protein [Gammaproteobacteria bacterium]